MREKFDKNGHENRKKCNFVPFQRGKRGETMDARQLIRQADQIAEDSGMTQAEWSRRAGFDEFGKLVSNMHRRGNCKLSVLAQLLKPLGCELRIVKQGEPEDENCELSALRKLLQPLGYEIQIVKVKEGKHDVEGNDG